MFATDILRQVQVQAVLYAALLGGGFLLLLRNVAERPPPPQRGPPLPMVPSVRQLLANGPYRRYLVFKVPMSIASLLPSNLIVDYIKRARAARMPRMMPRCSPAAPLPMRLP